MPQYPGKPFDPANTASRLPEPLRKPGGMALQVLMDLVGGDDPMSGMMPPVMGMAQRGLKLVKGAATPVAEMLGAEWSTPATHGSRRMLEAFRPKDLSKVLPEATGPSNVPPMPPTADAISKAFLDYRGRLGDLLLRNKR